MTFAVLGEGEDALLKKVAGHRFYNTAPWTFATLLNDHKNLWQLVPREQQ